MIAGPSAGSLIDTDVLVDFLRGRADAIDFLEGRVEPLYVSAISVAELFAGVRDDADARALDTFLQAFEVVPVDSPVAKTGGRLRGRFGPSHGTGLADAIIAASSESSGARLVTRNRKHYPMVRNVLVPY